MTTANLNAAFKVALAVTEAVRELGSVPKGHLYANMMSHISLEQFDGLIRLLVSQKLISEQDGRLAWIAE